MKKSIFAHNICNKIIINIIIKLGFGLSWTIWGIDNGC